VETSPSEEKLKAEFARHLASAQINMPRETSMANMQPMGEMNRFLLGNPYAMTYPNNDIDINLSKVDANNPMRDTMVHELTHVGQKPRGFVEFIKDRFNPPHQRRIEREAQNAEAMYPWREKGRDTWLPPEKKRK
jgi:hypothetical protein